MLRFFQKLADPFQSDGDAQPPANVWAYLVHNLKPFRWIIAVSLLFTVLNAGIEVWLIGYAGTLVDTLAASSPATLWATRGTELLLVALVIVVARPLTGLVREVLHVDFVDHARQWIGDEDIVAGNSEPRRTTGSSFR